MTRLIPIFAITALAAASCQKEATPAESATQAPPPTVPVEPIEKPVFVSPAVVRIASVSILEDCPDATPASRAIGKRGRGMDADSYQSGAQGDGEYAPPCGQSTIQLAITEQGDLSSTLQIVELRLLGADGTTLDILKARNPMIWKGNAYVPWNRIVLPKTDVQASFKLSVSNWSKVEKALGGSTYDRMYIVEADVSIGGVLGTIRSTQSPRQRPEMIDT